MLDQTSIKHDLLEGRLNQCTKRRDQRISMLDQTSMKHDLLEIKIKSVQEEKRSGDFYA